MPIRRARLALVSVKLSLSAGTVSYFTLPSSLPILAHSLPPPYAQASRSVHHCPVLLLPSCSLGSIKGIQRSVFPTDHHIKCTLHRLMHPPPSLSSCLRRHGIVRAILQIFVLLKKNSNQCWRHCHHKVATLMDLHFFVSSACHARAIFLTGERSKGKQRRSS